MKLASIQTNSNHRTTFWNEQIPKSLVMSSFTGEIHNFSCHRIIQMLNSATSEFENLAWRMTKDEQKRLQDEQRGYKMSRRGRRVSTEQKRL